ncbi:MAG: dihydroorotase, partial [Actinobacteria bacterium]|nr:dihydroorotase [Actinomycetota bacterium]
VIHAMANTLPVTDTAEKVMAVWNRGRELGVVDIRPIGAVTKGLGGAELAPIAAMHDTEAAPMVFSDDGHCVSRADLMRTALRTVAEFGGVIAQHAQDPDLTSGAQANEGEPAKRMGFKGWPVVAESAIVARDVLLAADTGARLHVCHVSAAQTVEVLRWAKSRGIDVTAEVTPHHLLLTDDLILSGDPVFKVNPPLRSAHDVHAVREALADGTIDAVATDHAPHEDEHKSCAWSAAAMGMLGLETAFAIVWQVMVESGLIKHSRLIDIMSTAPARIGGVVAPKIEIDAPANLVVIDPHARWQVDSNALHSLSNNTPFLGRNLPVRVVATLHNGRLTHQTERSEA